MCNNKKTNANNSTDNTTNTDNTNNNGNNNPETKSPENNCNFQRCLARLACFFILIGGIIFFLLPGMFILLGNVFPCVFLSDGALQTLSENINNTVGYISLFLGAFSIYYAFESSKTLEKQKTQQTEFLSQLDKKINKIHNKVKHIDKNTYELFDNIKSVSKSLEDRDKAHEDF